MIGALIGGNMQEISVDLPDALWLQNHFANYANPKAVISRLVRRGVLYRLKRGLYVKAAKAGDAHLKGKIANRLYGPSYVSFVYALRWYGMIPEHVAHITSATYGKSKKKRYDTPLGTFFYQDIPTDAYPGGIRFASEGRDRFLMASPEKALCDELYRIAGIRSLRRLERLLFEDLRLDADLFQKLDHQELILLSENYHATTLDTFINYLKRGQNA